MENINAWSGRLRKLGWLTLAVFTAKGLVTTSLIVWAVVSTGR